MPADLSRLLRPRSICTIGGREAARVVEQCRRMAFSGPVWPVHPSRSEMGGVTCYRSVEDLPETPDAAFVGVRRDRTVEVVRRLAARGAGGAVCYASGFAESGKEGADLQAALVEAAGDMPILGPNCYGLVNYLEGVPLWPDQHGGTRRERGVAIISQSSNLAITLTMNRRAVPIAVVATLGNRASIGTADVLGALLADGRITAVGLLVETLDDAPDLAAAALKARARGVPLVACKLGRSEEGARLTVSHTASLAGSDEAAGAFFRRTGIGRAHSLPVLLETLKLLHAGGPLGGREVASLSCSGGEAALMADAIDRRRLRARPLETKERNRVAATLNALVTVSNPLDYHTFIWGDAERLRQTFTAMLGCGFDLGLLVIDPPRTDRCDDREWHVTVDAFDAALGRTGVRGCVLAILPESFSETLSEDLLARGIAPLAGVEEGLAAVEAAADIGEAWEGEPFELEDPDPLAGGGVHAIILSEWDAKQRLLRAGVPIPAGVIARSPEDAVAAAADVGGPVAVKALGRGLGHKSEKGAVRLGLEASEEIETAARALLSLGDALLVERMVEDAVAEVIVGLRRDPQVGLVLLVGSGGELVELARDHAVLLAPATRAEIESALAGLRVAALVAGYRGRPAGDREALVDAVLTVQRFALDRAGRLIELDVNPLIVRPAGHGVVAADALMRMAEGDQT